MSDRLPQSATLIDAELTEWLLAHDEGLTQSEVEEFEGWLQRSPAHALAWAEAASLWESFDHAQDDEDLAALLQDARHGQPRTRFFALRPRQLFVGGGLLLAGALTIFIGVPQRPVPSEPQALAQQTFSTAFRRASYRLADGTQLTLDAGSTLAFSSNGRERIASLTRGRAYLDVHHQAGRSFVVHVGNTRITDEGTQFGIADENGHLSVTLTSGKVAILDPATGPVAVRLVPGQQFNRVGTVPGKISAINTADALAWRDGVVEFNRVPLSAAIAEMNRYTATPVQIADAKVGRYLVSGRFDASDPQRFASLLALTYPVRVVVDPRGQVTLHSRE